MTSAAGRRGPACSLCKFPVVVRGEIARQARAGEPVKRIAEWATNEGHAIGQDAMKRHLRACVGVEERPDYDDQQLRSVMVAQIVCSVFARWPSLAREAADALAAASLTVEAHIVKSTSPEAMRAALAETVCTPASELLAARCLVVAMARVFSKAHPDAARDIADALREQGADDLADSALVLAARATSYAADPRPVLSEDELNKLADEEDQRRARVGSLRAVQRLTDEAARSRAMSLFQHQNGPVRLAELREAQQTESTP